MVKITSFLWKANIRASCLPWKRKHPYYLLSVFMVYLSVGHGWLQRSNFQVNFHGIYNAFYFECSQISEFTWWARPLIISFMAPQTKGRITTILVLNNYKVPTYFLKFRKIVIGNLLKTCCQAISRFLSNQSKVCSCGPAVVSFSISENMTSWTRMNTLIEVRWQEMKKALSNNCLKLLRKTLVVFF